MSRPNKSLEKCQWNKNNPLGSDCIYLFYGKMGTIEILERDENFQCEIRGIFYPFVPYFKALVEN